MKKFLIPFLVLLVANIILNWQFYFHGLIPFPGDLLVSFYFPWNSGGFPEFNSWTTHKEVVGADAIRQIYPWKELVINQLKIGEWPLWNPYNFSGTPLLANLQSSVFSPVNLVFFVLPFVWGWISLVMFLPVIFGFGFYLFFKSLNLKTIPSLFGALVVMNISYITIWEEQLIHIQSILFLPFILLAINYKKYWFVPIFIALSVFGGHIQTVTYICILTFLFSLFKKVPLKWIAFIFVTGLLAASVQLLPTLELFMSSARDGSETLRLFPTTIIPSQSFITLLIPDFFGNPATGNFWGVDYANFELFAGALAIFFGLIGLISGWKRSFVKFFTLIFVIGLVFAATPLAYIWPTLHVPVLSSSNASRIFLLSFISISVLAAVGLENTLYYFNEHKKSIFVSCSIFIGVFLLIISYSIFLPSAFRSIAIRNTFIPGVVVGVGLFVVAINLIFKNKKTVLILSAILIFMAASFEYTIFYNKYQPFSSPSFVFPNHPVFTFLEDKADENRFFGSSGSYVETNFATKFKVFAPEGYDSLYIKRYGELLASSDKGTLPKSVMRSDAYVGRLENKNREKLFDLLGIKYILEKNDAATGSAIIGDRMVWHDGKFFAFERKSVSPRVFLASDYEVLTKNILDRFYEKDFDYKDSLILEKSPTLKPEEGGSPSANITFYSPNKVIINTTSTKPKILFLSDVYFPGWQVNIDGKQAEIYRADYTFRAVPISAGNHVVTFIYDPKNFKLGLLISVLTLLSLLGLCLKKSFHS